MFKVARGGPLPLDSKPSENQTEATKRKRKKSRCTILAASSPGVPPYCVLVRLAFWDRCTAAGGSAFCILPMTPSAPCLPVLNRRLGTRQETTCGDDLFHLVDFQAVRAREKKSRLSSCAVMLLPVCEGLHLFHPASIKL